MKFKQYSYRIEIQLLKVKKPNGFLQRKCIRRTEIKNIIYDSENEIFVFLSNYF